MPTMDTRNRPALWSGEDWMPGLDVGRTPKRRASRRRVLTRNQNAIVRVLREHADKSGATLPMILEWLKWCDVTMPRPSCYSAVRDLVNKGVVARVTVDRVALVESESGL